MNKEKLILDRKFSAYIRKRDTPGPCISCGMHITYDRCDAGHFIPRVHTSTRWDERNVNAQCIECNRHRSGNLEGYRRGLIKKYGPGILEELTARKNSTAKFSKSDITRLIIEYRKKLCEKR